MRTLAWLLIMLLAVPPGAMFAADRFGLVTFSGLPVPGATITSRSVRNVRRTRDAWLPRTESREYP
jgi:hypothetical protein